MNRDWARYARPGEGIELLTAHFDRHVYERHSHEAYAFGVTETGVQAFNCRGAAHASTPGTVMAFNPADPHDGHSGAEGGFSYRMLYIAPAVMRQTLEDAAERPAPLPFFLDPLVRDAAVAQLLWRLHRALEAAAPPLARDVLLAEALVALAARHGERAHRPPAKGGNMPAIRRIRDYLHAAFAEEITLDRLAAIAGMSRFHLSRQFRRATGLPPHTYLLQLRLREARRLLAAGEAPAEVAAAVGFVDQSHFTRRFKGAYGITPAVFARAAPYPLQSPGSLIRG